MRAVILGLTACLLSSQAMSADFLRGSTDEDAPSGHRWSGWYVGGQVGYTHTEFEFGPATRGMAGNILRSLWVEEQFKASQLPKLPGRTANGMSYGGFVGYNAAWGDVVLGVELNYSRTSAGASSSDIIGRAFVNQTTSTLRDDVLLTSSATARLTDLASLRFRAGYAMDWLMPYMMVGFAAGHGSFSRGITANIVETDSSTTPATVANLTVSDFETRNHAFTMGFAAGGGVEVAVSRNIFMRAEYEYMYLAPMGGINFNISTFRAGGGLRF